MDSLNGNFWGNVDAGVVLDAIDTVVRVQVLVQSDLEDGCTTLAGSNNGRSEEVFPGTEPPITSEE